MQRVTKLSLANLQVATAWTAIDLGDGFLGIQVTGLPGRTAVLHGAEAPLQFKNAAHVLRFMRRQRPGLDPETVGGNVPP